MEKIGFIGCGNMGEAMLAGCLKRGGFRPENIYVHTADEKSERRLEKTYGVNTTTDNITLVNAVKYIVFAVKPQVYPTVIAEVKSAVKRSQVLISISPAWTGQLMKEYFANDDLKCVHAIPNTPAMVGCSMTGICFGDRLSQKEKEQVLFFFRSFGEATEISPDLIPAVLATSSSSPAYVYMLIEAFVQGGIEQGLTAAQARLFAAKTVEGAARMVLESKRHPAELREAVCSPAGTTIAGVSTLEKGGFNGLLMEAMKASVERLKEM